MYSQSYPILLNEEIKKALTPTPLKLIYPQTKKVKLPTFKVIKFKKFDEKIQGMTNKNNDSKASVTTLTMPATLSSTTKNVKSMPVIPQLKTNKENILKTV